MKKLSLDQFKAVNFASQATAGEPTNVKRDKTTPWWLLIVGAAIIYTVIEIYKAYENDNDQPRLKSKTVITYPTPSGTDSTVTTYIYY